FPKGIKPRFILIYEFLLFSSSTTSYCSNYLLTLFRFHPFSHPKPMSLISDLVNIVVSEGDIVLDFFAGSGSTANAIFRLNTLDNANRQFIS
ncbi:DNA methyltransferase, partial [Poseidonibacter lekithochrous]|uniref:DNA methyltransferase n=1 Tax=Poseidonibacter lekithochrous TaxID=1904463 RepID=UPI0013DD7FD9